MNNKVKPLISIVLGALIFFLNACSSIPVKMVYDDIPEEQQSVFKIGADLGSTFVVTSFDGKKVRWGKNSEIKIPAGEHIIEYYFSETAGNIKYSDKGEKRFNFVIGRIYEFIAYREGDFVYYRFETVGITPFGTINQDETLINFKKVGLGDYPTFVHVYGVDNNKNIFYLPRSYPKTLILPNGTYTIYGSKSRNGKGGDTFEIELKSEEVFIDVIGPTLVTQPKIRLKETE